jgi:hypothetical protein
MYNILISGAGQLGSRYLQGLSKCRNHLRIHVQDIASDSLLQAEQRWQEVGGLSSDHKVSFHTDIKQCPQQLSLAIIATTARCRPEVVGNIAQQCKVRNWILEKVLAQNTQGLEEIQLHVGRESLAWVNTSRRIHPWYRVIKEKLQSQKTPLHFEVTGVQWGLACNSVHFLDLMVWLSGESLVTISTDQLDDDWYNSKRAGNWEIFGTLTATFSDGSTANLTASNGDAPTCLIELTEGNDTWRIDEANGTAVHTGGAEISWQPPYQSETTTALVDEILDTGSCPLPTLFESVAIHRPFIAAMLGHWQRNRDSATTLIPIT